LEEIIVGIDPGFQVTGYAILKKESTCFVVLDFGFLKLSQKKHLSERMLNFYDFFKKKIIKFGINVVALETPFLGKNVQTFLKLGYLRGGLYLLAAQHNLKILEFTPRQIKMNVTGFGGASKDQVAEMVCRFLPKLKVLQKTVKRDVTDALAIAICASWHSNSRLGRLEKIRL